tara:strand:+ start:1528 stop:2823 length:1296 start_codon:yes stop_codon:yes gene_type:complete
MKNTFVISCPIDTYSGYGARSRDFVKALIELGEYDVQILSQRWGKCAEGFIKNNEDWGFLSKHIIPQLMSKPDYWCQITVPNEFQVVGKYNIGLTAGMETTIVDGSWVEGCNRMDLIMTSSNHSKNTFLNSKFHKGDDKSNVLEVTKPIEVLIEGLNLDVYKITKEFNNKELYKKLDSIPEDFAYLSVGHWMQGEMGEDRKNIGLTIKAFYELFKNRKNPPALILKCCIVNSSILDRSEIQRRIEIIKNGVPDAKTLPKVYLLHGNFTDPEMNELYNHPKVKAMVSLTKGEGYGRPLLEFSAINKPIIATNWSGHIDFLQGDYTTLVGGELEKVHPTAVIPNMILAESEWFKPALKDIGYGFNTVWDDYDNWLEKAKGQGFYSRKNFSFNSMKEQIKAIFDKNLIKLPKKMDLNIGKIEMPKKPKTKLKKI